MRRRTALGPSLVALSLALSGCTGDDPEDVAADHRAEWRSNEPEAYAYWYFWGSGETSGYSVRVEIVNGHVVRTDIGPDVWGDYGGPEVPTIEDVFDLLDQANASADAVEVEFDPEFSFPVDVSIDREEDAIDDEYGFGIAGFAVLPPPADV